MGDMMKPTGVHLFALVPVLAGLLLIVSCGFGSKVPSRNFFIINYTPEARAPVESGRPHPYSLQVQQFGVQRIYNRQNIVYRFAPQELKWYEYQQWAVRPDYMVTDIVYKHLESANLFNRVGTEFLETRPDFRLEGTVDAIERFDAGDLIFGHLAMSFKMVRIEDGQQLWEYSFDERKQVYQKEMVYTVIGLSQIMQSQMNSVVSQLDSLFASLGGGALMKGQPVKVQEPRKAAEDTSKAKKEDTGYEIIPESRIKR
jgi:ABC-type uncharacterized transport system auxiliary subunit